MVATTVSERKRWVSKIYNSQETKMSTNISWSDSDEEPPLKKPINYLENKTKSNWINLNSTPIKPIPLQQSEKSLSGDDPFGSPVISQFRHEDQSPILTQIDKAPPKEQSPVLNRSRIVRKIKWKYKRKKEQSIENEESPVKSQIIIVSPTQSPVEPISVSPFKSEVSDAYYIDSASSQHSSEVISDFSSFSASSSKISPNQPPVRKKRPKKGSFNSQVLKAISLQSSSAAIWEHEKFLEKSKGVIGGDCDLEFMVIRQWVEYGCNMLKCRSNKNLKLFSDCTEIDNDNTFLLISGTNACISFEANLFYQIAPPFSTRVVTHELENLLCVFNVSRIIGL